MRFYETKYRFNIKELRPFAGTTQIRELNPLYNEEVYEREMKKFNTEQSIIKKEQERKIRIIEKNID